MKQEAELRHGMPSRLSLRERLRQETRQEHEALEAALDLLRPGLTLQCYADLLQKYHGFYAPFERFIDAQAQAHSPAALFYQQRRGKQAWLAQDLKALGLEPDGALEIPPARLQALFPTSCHLVGAVYVVEGSMLGGAVLAKHFQRQLGLPAEAGLRFFAGYRDELKARWQETLTLLENYEQQAQSLEQAIQGARNMFLLLHRHLTHAN